MTLSGIYPLTCDERGKPFGWSWMEDANIMDIPGMDSHTALAFYLACTFWDYEDIRLLTLHRMVTAISLEIPSDIPEAFDLDHYIASGELHFTIGGTIKLKALFSKDAAFHLEERPLNDDQIITEQADGRVLIEATVQDTSELRWWLLGYGDNLEVLEPQAMRDAFQQIISRMASKYS